MVKNKIVYFIIQLIAILLICQCQNSQKKFVAPESDILDSTCRYLGQFASIKDTNYNDVWQKAYTQQLKTSNYDSAARILFIVATTLHRSDLITDNLGDTLKRFVKIRNEIFPDRYKAKIYTYIGRTYNNNDSFIKYVKKGIIEEPYDFYTQYESICNYYLLLSVFTEIGKYDSALKYGIIAKKLSQNTSAYRFRALPTLDLHLVYLDINDVETAKNVLEEALIISKEDKDSSLVFTAYESYINLLMSQEKNEISKISNYTDSMNKFLTLSNRKLPVYNFMMCSKFANLHLLKSEQKEAKFYIDSLSRIKFFKKFISPDFKLDLEMLRIRYNLKFNISSNDLTEFKNSIDSFKKEKNYNVLRKSYELLIEVYLSQKDYKNAFNYKLLLDEVNKNRASIHQIKTILDFEAKKTQAIQEQKIRSQKIVIFIISIGLIIVTLMGAWLIKMYKKLSKQKDIITTQNDLNEKLISIISHDIKEPLLTTKLLIDKLKIEDLSLKNISINIENQINSINSLLNNLLKIKNVHSEDERTEIDMDTIKLSIKETLVLNKYKIIEKNILIEDDFTLNHSLTLPISNEKFKMIFHNLLSNALKYSYNDSKIQITTSENSLCIIDHGIGIDPNIQLKLFNNKTKSIRGTNNESGNGFGLYLIGSMIKNSKLSITFSTPEQGGTIVKLSTKK